MRENLYGALEDVSQDFLPSGANVIGFHTVYKVKDDGGSLLLRSAVSFNLDRNLFSLRRYSSSTDLSMIRLALFLSVILGFFLGTSDLKGPYMHSVPIRCDIFDRPPK